MLYTALILTAANLALWIVFFLVCKKKFSADVVLGKIRGEVRALLTDIRQETDMSATLIEGRIDALKQLIDDADSRILLAKKTEENRERERKVIEALAAPAAVDAPLLGVSTAPAPVKPPATYAPPKNIRTKPLAPAAAPAQESSAAPRITFAREQIQPRKSTKTAALELAAAGFSSEIIAEKLDISITEARTIVNLYGM
ncbi:MAG: hypothetical protein Pg6C_13500 [Treponemataceae bacterium]|nr:MAG: hypothetical protein Pg6C_13500 [Treponemataceae bacterium]